MEIPDFINQFSKLKEKELEQKVWELWLVKWPYMTEEDYVSYERMLDIAKHGEAKQQEAKQEIPVNGIYIDQVFF